MQFLNFKYLSAAIMLVFAMPALAVDVNFNVPVNVTDYPGKNDLTVYCTAGPQTTGVKSGTVKVPLVNGNFYGNVKVTVKGLEPLDVQPGYGAYECRLFAVGGELLAIMGTGQIDNSKPSKLSVNAKF